MKKILFALSALAILFTGCTIEQEYTFHENWSGTYLTRVDLTSMAALSGGEEESEPLLNDTMVSELQTKYEAIPGISNVQTSGKDNILLSGFDFSSTDALNAAFKPEDGAATSSNLLSFERKGKKGLVVKVDKSAMGEEAAAGTEQMGEMITFKIALRFDKKIKKIKSKVATLDKENNIVHLEFNFTQLSDKNVDLNTEITLK